MQIKTRDKFCELIDTHKYKICAEIGVQHGDFSRHLLNSNLEKLYLIDCWQHQTKYVDVANVQQQYQDEIYNSVITKFKNDKRVQIIKGFSLSVCREFPINYFDFVYLDSDHSYDHISKEIKKWYKKVKPGGMIAGHDYVDGIINNTEFGVKKAVDEFISRKNKKLYVCEEPFPSFYFIK